MKKSFMSTIFVMLLTIISPIFAQWEEFNKGMSSSLPSINSFAISDQLLLASTNKGIFENNANFCNWKKNGHNEQFITSLINANNSFLLTTTYDNIFKSTDNGNSWVQILSSEKVYPTSILSIAFYDNKLFIGCRSGMFVSKNIGKDWSQVTSINGSVNTIASDSINIYAGSTSGLYISSDKGLNWYLSSKGMPIVTPSVKSINIIDSSLVIGTNKEGVYRSTNNGISWIESNNGIQEFSTVNSIVKASKVLYIGTNKGVYKSLDNGIHWILMNNGFPSYSMAIKCLIIKDSYLYAGTENSGIYRYKLINTNVVDYKTNVNNNQANINPIPPKKKSAVIRLRNSPIDNTEQLIRKEYGWYVGEDTVDITFIGNRVGERSTVVVIRTDTCFAHSEYNYFNFEKGTRYLKELKVASVIQSLSHLSFTIRFNNTIENIQKGVKLAEYLNNITFIYLMKNNKTIYGEVRSYIEKNYWMKFILEDLKYCSNYNIPRYIEEKVKIKKKNRYIYDLRKVKNPEEYEYKRVAFTNKTSDVGTIDFFTDDLEFLDYIKNIEYPRVITWLPTEK